MADAPDPITSPPDQDFQPYDPSEQAATNHAAPWSKVPGGPCGPDGQLTGEDFPNGPGPWKQT